MQIAFYEAIAQLLPVIFLAILVEYRLLAPAGKHGSLRMSGAITSAARALVAFSFVGAEWVALHALAAGTAPNSSADNVILVAYLVAVLALVWPLWERALDDQEQLSRWKGWMALVAGNALFLVLMWGAITIVR